MKNNNMDKTRLPVSPPVNLKNTQGLLAKSKALAVSWLSLLSLFLCPWIAAAFNTGDRIMAAPGGVNVRDNSLLILFLQTGGVHGTIAASPIYATAGGYTGYWYPVHWDSGPPLYGDSGWSADYLLSLAPSAGDVAEPNLTASFYTTGNVFWQSGNAPASTSPPNPQLGNALGNCTWYACGRMLELGFGAAQINAMSGDAQYWNTEARDAGIAVDTTPTVHSIAQSVSQDHVAVVESVNNDGTITVTESSFVQNTSSPWDILWRHRTVSPTWFDDFIHPVAPVTIMFTTTPIGLQVTVDGNTSTTPVSFNWIPETQHYISVPTPQYNGLYSRCTFEGAQDQLFTTPITGMNVNANLTQQYALTMTAGNGGGLSQNGGWYAAGTAVQISATPNPSYVFTGWSGTGDGSYSGLLNPASVTMNAPIFETAAFTSINPPVFGGASASGGQIQTTLKGLTIGQTVVVEISTDLRNWIPVQTNNVSTSTLSISSSIKSGTHQQFLRGVVH